jgi:hypothetical protein
LQQIEGLDYGRFYFAGYMAHRKADPRASSFLDEVVLHDGHPLRATELSIHETGEDKIINAIISAPKKAAFRKRRRH